MKIQGDEISGYESSMGRKFRHENTIYVNEIYEYSIDRGDLFQSPLHKQSHASLRFELNRFFLSYPGF